MKTFPAARGLGRRLAFGALLLGVAVVFSPSPSGATQFQGYARTGWDYDNKRDCCDDAVAMAQDNAADSCEAAGGRVRRFGSARGNCNWDADGNGYDRAYQCEAKASVDCD